MADSVPTMASKRTVQLLLVLTIVISIWVSRLHGQLWALAPIGVLCSLAWCVCCTAVLAVCPVVAHSLAWPAWTQFGPFLMYTVCVVVCDFPVVMARYIHLPPARRVLKGFVRFALLVTAQVAWAVLVGWLADLALESAFGFKLVLPFAFTMPFGASYDGVRCLCAGEVRAVCEALTPG